MLLMNRYNNRSGNVPSQIVFPMTLFSYCNIPGKYQLILRCASSTLHRITSKFRIIFCTSEIYESKSKSGDILEGSLTLMQQKSDLLLNAKSTVQPTVCLIPINQERPIFHFHMSIDVVGK